MISARTFLFESRCRSRTLGGLNLGLAAVPSVQKNPDCSSLFTKRMQDVVMKEEQSDDGSWISGTFFAKLFSFKGNKS